MVSEGVSTSKRGLSTSEGASEEEPRIFEEIDRIDDRIEGALEPDPTGLHDDVRPLAKFPFGNRTCSKVPPYEVLRTGPVKFARYPVQCTTVPIGKGRGPIGEHVEEGYG